MKKIDWNEQRENWANEMNPCPIWNEGSDAQQEFADSLVVQFCNRFAKYLCWAAKDELVELDIIDFIIDHIFSAINEIDDAKWWCNKKKC